MKLTIVGTTAGSILGFRRDLLSFLVQQGHQVYTFATDYPAAQKVKVKALGAIHVDYTLSRAGMNPLADLKTLLKLRKLLKDIQSDVVFSYFSKPVIYGTLAAVLAKVSCRVGMLEGLGFVFTDQSTGQSFKTKLIRRIQAMLYSVVFRFADRVIF